jgi:hypothetical protein
MDGGQPYQQFQDAMTLKVVLNMLRQDQGEAQVRDLLVAVPFQHIVDESLRRELEQLHVLCDPWNETVSVETLQKAHKDFHNGLVRRFYKSLHVLTTGISIMSTAATVAHQRLKHVGWNESLHSVQCPELNVEASWKSGSGKDCKTLFPDAVAWRNYVANIKKLLVQSTPLW